MKKSVGIDLDNDGKLDLNDAFPEDLLLVG